MSVMTYEQAPALSPGATAGASGRKALTIEVVRDTASLRPMWERMAQGGIATPYQGFDWIAHYARHVDAADGAESVTVVMRDAAGQPALLLPLSVTKTGGALVAQFTGGKHANFHAPVFSAAAHSLTEAEMTSALITAGAELGIDVFAFHNQPQGWEGTANPFALLGGQPAPSAAYKFSLAADAEAVLRAQLSKDTRKKLRQKEARLAQVGPVSYRIAATPEEARQFLDAFLTLKAARFAEQGISDPFAGPEVRAFLDAVATTRTEAGRPVFELHALFAGERPVAIYGGVADARRFCGVVTAFDSDPEIARSSPGDILLTYMVRDCCQRGLATFDLGVGEAHYKSKICDQVEPLFDTFLPVTFKGRVAVLAMTAGGRAKRWLKHSPTGQKLIGLMRKMKARA